MAHAPPMPEKRTLIEIVGGDCDGRTFDSASIDPYERQIVFGVLQMTQNGTQGKGFQGVSISALEALARGKLALQNIKPSSDGSFHSYTVLKRCEVPESVLIRIEYSVTQPSQPQTDQ
jgi:hypothetical protein